MNEGKEVISRITATINLAGLPESGKTTLIDHMLGRPINKENLSTGVCESTIMVDINPSSTVSTVGLNTHSQSENLIWKETNCDISFLSQYYGNKKQTSTVSTDAEENLTHNTTPTVLRQTSPIQNSEASSLGSSNYSQHDIDLSDKIMDVLDKCGIESIEDLKTKGSLYIRDVGGQIEFQESLSLLIYGPSIYLFVFNANIDINKKQIIRYRVENKKKVVKKEVVKGYQSSISTRDALLQCLASIKALQITENAKTKENVKPQVIIVGTHMDLLSKSASKVEEIKQQLPKLHTMECTSEEIMKQLNEVKFIQSATKLDKIKQLLHKYEATPMPTSVIQEVKTQLDDFIPTTKKINEQLDEIIVDSKCKDFVQYIKKDKGEVMFAVDNESKDDEGVKDLCGRINYIVTKKTGFKVDYPVRYILFALNLPNIKCNVLTLQDCKDIAKQFKIEDDKVPHLLDFLQLKTGILLWFDVNNLRDWVFKEPQFLFNKVTSLISETFIDSDNKDQNEVSEFRKKGIFEKEVVNAILSGDDKLSSEKFLEFLIHLRMVARFDDAKTQKEKYFIPCVLNHVVSSSSKKKTDIPPLNITFQCGYCPKGLFGVLATYFITPNKEHRMCDDVMFTVTFLEDQIFKDEFAFKALFDWEQHTVYLKMHPSHLEVTFLSCPVKCRRGTRLQIACNAIRVAMSRYIDYSLDHLHYNKSSVVPEEKLQCPKHGCTELHKAVGHTKRMLYCEDVPQEIPSKAKYWFNEGKECMNKINICSYDSETLINT